MQKDDLKINWYRSPVDREMLAQLNQRSDWKGLAQTLGHLGLLVLTATAVILSIGRLPWWGTLLLIYIHGTFYAFLLNATHELVHKTVFKSKNLNTVFTYIVSFACWNNPVFFWASHQEHHKYTLFYPYDQEVVLPFPVSLSIFLKSAIINPWDFFTRLTTFLRLSFGRLQGDWEQRLFPPSAVEQRRRLFTWVRVLLLGQLLVAGLALYFGQWIVLVVFTFAPFYGGALQFLCNNDQHTGLVDRTQDYRLNTRTIYYHPFISFLYWHMNYHIEHHMYAAVPCYNLAKVHEQIKADLPHCPASLFEAWKQIIWIIQKQKTDPGYQFVAQLPPKPGL